ncbi:hypothetical protein [Sorangium sp. So ce385]|uniref:hypothetical protein n=1 Tax=Sorangium sp. So ce385 TaxID=3133308 RepID=UPI003F5C2E91
MLRRIEQELAKVFRGDPWGIRQAGPLKPSWRAIVVLGMLSWTLGCTASIVPGRSLGSGARSLVEEAPDVYAPEAALMQAFAPGDDLRRTLLDALPKATRALAKGDPALDCVASVIAENYPEDETAPSKLLQQWIAWRCGAMSPDFHFNIRPCIGRCTSVLLDSLLRRLAGPLTHYDRRFSYGLSRRRRGQWHVQVVVSDERLVESQARVRRSYAPGDTLSLKLRLNERLRSPIAYIQADGDRTIKRELSENPDGGWELAHRLPSTYGTYFVELVADVEHGSEREGMHWQQGILMFPTHVGSAKAPEPDVFMPKESERVPDGAPRIEQLLERYNAQRRLLGRPVITWDAEIATLAATRAELDANAVQLIPPDAALDLKLDKMGISLGQFWQTQARFEVLHDYVRTQLLRPSVRAEQIDTGAVRVGIGIAPRPVEEGRPRSYSIVEYWVFPRDGASSAPERESVDASRRPIGGGSRDDAVQLRAAAPADDATTRNR